MTVEEIVEIRKQEKQGVLPLTSIAQTKSKEQLNNEFVILNGICSIIMGDEKDKKMWLKPNLLQKLTLRTYGIKEFGWDEANERYYVNTEYGNASFYDAKKMFNNNCYSDQIRKNFCFSNCLTLAKLIENETDIVCGLAFIDGKSFAHAVIQIKDFVVDFNYELIMSADLYYKFMNFEKVNIISSKQLKQDWDKIVEYCSTLKYPYNRDWVMLFAYDEYIQKINEKKLEKELNKEVNQNTH